MPADSRQCGSNPLPPVLPTQSVSVSSWPCSDSVVTTGKCIFCSRSGSGRASRTVETLDSTNLKSRGLTICASWSNQAQQSSDRLTEVSGARLAYLLCHPKLHVFTFAGQRPGPFPWPHKYPGTHLITCHVTRATARAEENLVWDYDKGKPYTHRIFDRLKGGEYVIPGFWNLGGRARSPWRWRR